MDTTSATTATTATAISALAASRTAFKVGAAVSAILSLVLLDMKFIRRSV